MTDEDRGRYYQRATSWALDQQSALLASVRRARLVAGVAGLIAVLEAVALLVLLPLKTQTVLPLLVDRQTGYVERLNPDGAQQVRANAALTKSLLVQYVVARESFNITDLSAAYHKVSLWSAGPARRDYLALMPASNPDSPLRRYPRDALLETSVKSVSPLGPSQALVRFETRLHDPQGGVAPAQPWAAVVGFRFSDEALSASDRWLNPLGFQVVSYQRDAEALSSEPATRPAAPEASSAAEPAR